MLFALLLTFALRWALRVIFEIHMLFALLLTFALFVGRVGCKLFWFVIRPASNVCPFFVRAMRTVSNLLVLFALLFSCHLNFLLSQVARFVFLAIVLSKVVIFCRPCVNVRALVVLLLQTCLSVVFVFLGLQS